MIYILEGPEAAGKSTLAKQLSEMHNAEIIHFDKPKTEAEKLAMFDMYVRTIYDNDNIILDRCWYSEMVYGPIMRDKSYISVAQMHELEELMLRNHGGILIHCTQRVNTLWDRCNVRGEDYVTDIDTLTKIKYGFEKLAHGTLHKIPVLRYEYNENLS